MNFKIATTVLVTAAVLVGSSGCGDGNKADIPKDLNKPLPPPPVGTGGGKLTKQPSATEQ